MLLLSFDMEEFDLPKEHGVDIPFDEQIAVSTYGADIILDCLKVHQVKATFFCTANFALQSPQIIERIHQEGHELASHGLRHGSFKEEDLLKSRIELESFFGDKVSGYRQARMMPVSEKAIADAGYLYNSSLNPTLIPGRYNHLNVSRTPFKKDGVVQMPSSVTPIIRFPLFWLSAHVLPKYLYYRLCAYTHHHDDYLALYFHPWEFYPLYKHPEYGVPHYISRHTGEKMFRTLSGLLQYCAERKIKSSTFSEYLLR
jgi:peptidoglycan/xylan/chitin deacetylase (PgdA/CDA1 family)